MNGGFSSARLYCRRPEVIENLTQLKSSTMWDPKINGFRSTTLHFFLGGVYCQRERFMGYFRAACRVQT